jgi:flagellar basal body-associated protein FliL
VKSSFIHEGEEKMKRILFIILAVVAVFLILGIAFTSMVTQSSPSVDVASREFGFGGGGAPEVGVAPAMEAPALDPSVVSNGDAYNTGTVQTQERLVIENADLAIVVKDPKARMAEINALANEFGGYVVSSNLFQSFTSFGKEVPEASIVIRVPSERLDEALTRIKEDVVDIDYENRSGQDVTNIYVDLQAQLKAKQAAEAKLLEIMDQATRAEDVLAIYLQVQQVQTEIEQLKGQIKYYEESAAMSSISVRLIAEEGTQPIEIGPWTPKGAAKDAIQDLIRFVQNFSEFLIRFVLLTLPALILIAIPLLLVYLAGRAVYRRVRRSRVAVEDMKSEEGKK